MTIIPFPTSSRPGSHPVLGQGRLVNAHAVREGDKVYWRRVAGMKIFADPLNFSGLYHGPRGLFQLNNDVLWIFKDRAARVDYQGKTTLLSGEVNGAVPATVARNNREDTDYVIVSNNTAYMISGNTVVEYDAKGGSVGSPNDVSMLDGYFLFTYQDGTVIASELNSTEINSLSSWRAESTPDKLLRGMVSGQLFYAFGTASIEVLQDVGTAPFPLARQAVIPVGLIGKWAVAGGAVEGWDRDLLFVAQDGTVRLLSGYQTQTVSIPDVTRDIRSVADKDTLIASVYVMGENAFWSLSSPNWTWEYNVTTGEWHQRKSNRKQRWRAAYSVYVQGKWIVGDTESGKLFELSDRILTEDTEPLVFEVESDAVKGFPSRVQCRRADFDLNVGYGREIGLDPVETEPLIEISWSDDGGVSWSNPLHRRLGREGQYQTLTSVLNTGMSAAQGRKWKLRVSDPVPVTLAGGVQEAKVGLY
ncbi:hypothetical protein WJT86_10110 [Microvirga sp. W0021]|uniref:Uncharacterized protein n=1 Tax=Hohaiivirga grylli TaxID=3133970 RepID=A0ABV0BKG5_9HYPH